MAKVDPTQRIDGTSGELTGAQIALRQSYQPGVVPRITYNKIRLMRKHPIVALCRYMFFAGVLSGEWSFEGDDVERVEFIESQLKPLRRHILATGALGCFDFGWQPYEKVFGISGDMSTKLVKLKPLLQDFTEIKEDLLNGSFEGFRSGVAELPLEKCLLLNFDVEGTDWKGTSTVENAEASYDRSNALQESAARFDSKMAGAHWVIRYPDGKTNFNGEATWNYEIADAILSSLQSSGMVAIPISQALMQSDVYNEKLGWHIELITAQGASFPFADRFGYLDTQIARSLGFPERTILEGKYGTKAEAGAHQDFLITLIEYRHDCIIEQINWHLINQLLRLNYGENAENSVVLKASAINDVDRAMVQSVYDKIISNADGFLAEMNRLDIDALAESLGLPRIDLADEDGEELPPIVMPAAPPVEEETPPVEEETPPEPEPEAPVEQPVQATALNGAQISSLLEIIALVSSGDMPKPSAVALIGAAFQSLTPEQISAILDPIEVKEKPDDTNQLPQNLPTEEPTGADGDPGSEGEQQDSEDDEADAGGVQGS